MKKWYKFPNNTILDLNLFNSFWLEPRPQNKFHLFGRDQEDTYALGEFDSKDEIIKFFDVLFAYMNSNE